MLTCPQKSGLKESNYLLAIRLDIAKSALFTWSREYGFSIYIYMFPTIQEIAIIAIWEISF